jgi:hypothetical protein
MNVMLPEIGLGVSAKGQDGMQRSAEESRSSPWERLIQDADVAEDQAEAAGVAAMRENGDVHLSVAVAHLLVGGSGGLETFEIVFPHLTICSFCRNTLRETLRLTGTNESSAVSRLLDEAVEWVESDAIGQTASETARQRLLNNGIGYAFGRDGVVYEMLPDGTERPVIKDAAA